jgi:hypothetical protein
MTRLDGRLLLATLALAGAIVVAGARRAAPAGGGGGTACFETTGPDVIVGVIHDEVANYDSFEGVDAFSIGTTSCNIGTGELSWIGHTAEHPVIAQGMFRLRDGRFEQVGQAWVKHGFFATTGTECCEECTGSGTGDRLGVGCSDPYTARRNGQQYGLGPKFEINAFTGTFPYPPYDPFFFGPVERRLQVHLSDLDPQQKGGGLYFVEAHYVTADDAAAGNQHNNASHRQVGVVESDTSWDITMEGMPPTVREVPVLHAWCDHDPAVVIDDFTIPDEGRLVVAARATDLGTGWHRYEYAVQNVNSDRAVGSFRVPINAGALVANAGFHDVDYHSGEPFDATDWTPVVTPDAITWSTTGHDVDPEANALRWGTIYNLRFDSTAAPVDAELVLGLFKPGTPASVTAVAIGPDTGPADCNMNGVDDDDDIAGGTSLDCDGNGIPDECDPDCDGDATPDACEDDTDGDGHPDDCDNCPGDHNPDQADHDDDGVGNPCDADYCLTQLFADDFEAPVGWTTTASGATDGFWERAVPVDDPSWPHDPESDADGSGRCFVTDNAAGWSDVDDGVVILRSPPLDFRLRRITIRYDYFLNLTRDDGNDRLVVQASSTGLGGPWTDVAVHDRDQGVAWTTHLVTPETLDAANVAMTSTMRIRFIAYDAPPDDVVEAAVDAVVVTTGHCYADCNDNDVDDALDIADGTSADVNDNGVPDECECIGDADGDGAIGFQDLLVLLQEWGPCLACPSDLDGSDAVAFGDLLQLLFLWGPCR